MKRSLTHCLFCIAALALTAAGIAEAQQSEQRGILYDFGASWCGPCQQVAPLVSRLEREGLPIRKVDIDKERELADRFHIQRVPTFVLVVDGKEVLRKQGVLAETTLRGMLAQIPSESRNLAATSMEIPVDLGTPGQIPRPRAAPLRSEVQVAAAEEERRGIKELWPFNRKREEPAIPTVRGNDTELGDPAPFSSPNSEVSGLDPMLASVRIRVIMGSTVNAGSGTIIASTAGVTNILTCGHIFRDFNDDAKIEVDIFQSGQPKSYIARLQKFDLESDLGLITVPTDVALKSVAVPDVSGVPQVADQVACIGCSGGADPTRRQLRVTAIDKYEGTNNIECTGLPVQGRSGGGLFNQKGEIVGVCIAADEEGNRGLYSGLLAVHQLLDECNLTALYKSTAPATPTEDANPFASLADVEAPTTPLEIGLGDTPVSLPNHEINGPPAGSPAHAATNIEAGQAEVVVIIRDKSRPNAPNRVVIIHDASSKFFSYLDGELGNGVPTQPLTDLGRPLRSVASGNRPTTITAGQLKSQLIPTALSTPVIPKRYTRP